MGHLTVCARVAAWPSGKAGVCKTLIPGSNPGAAFKNEEYTERDVILTGLSDFIQDK